MTNLDQNNTKKVGWLLGIGIFLVPIIFAWFTLRKGHSTPSRVLSFAWLIIPLLLISIIPDVPTENMETDVSSKTNERVVTLEENESKVSSIPSEREIGNEETKSRSTVAIPKDVTYTIIKKYVLPNIKRTLDVRLNQRVSQDVLRSIAIELKNSDPKRYERTFITYYLPDMKFGTNAGWATTHFNPDLEVSILGLTVEQEESFFNEPEDSSREIVGTWYDENPSFVVKFTIYRQDGKLYVEEKFKDGSGGSSEVVEKASPTGQEFQKKSGSTLGSYYLIDRQGNLQVRYQEGGLFAEAKKIK